MADAPQMSALAAPPPLHELLTHLSPGAPSCLDFSRRCSSIEAASDWDSADEFVAAIMQHDLPESVRLELARFWDACSAVSAKAIRDAVRRERVVTNVTAQAVPEQSGPPRGTNIFANYDARGATGA